MSAVKIDSKQMLDAGSRDWYPDEATALQAAADLQVVVVVETHDEDADGFTLTVKDAYGYGYALTGTPAIDPDAPLCEPVTHVWTPIPAIARFVYGRGRGRAAGTL